MTRMVILTGGVLLLLATNGQTQTKDAKGPKKLAGKSPDEIVEFFLKQMDTDKDGKISRAEAKAKLAEAFDKIDTNKDGYLDRKELRVLAVRILGQKGGPGFPNGPDFDALDRNADGRLTPAELKGTPWAARFAEIDTDGNGSISRREFETFLRKAVKEKK
jgi:Ca2+-binding EF-hand superfamily protein